MKCSVNLLCIVKYAEAKSGFLSITNGRSLATAHQYTQLKEQEEEEFTPGKQGTSLPHSVRLNLRRKKLKGNSLHTGGKVKVDGRVDKKTGNWFWRNNGQEITTVGGPREPFVSLMNL